MNYIDLAIAFLLVFALVRGAYKGLIIEVSSLIAIGLGVYGAVQFTYVEDYLIEEIKWNTPYTPITAKVITFVVVVVVVMFIGKMITKALKMASLGILNRILGAIFGVLKMAFILSFVCYYFLDFNKKINLLSEEQLQESVLLVMIGNLQEEAKPYVEKVEAHTKRYVDKSEEPIDSL